MLNWISQSTLFFVTRELHSPQDQNWQYGVSAEATYTTWTTSGYSFTKSPLSLTFTHIRYYILENCRGNQSWLWVPRGPYFETHTYVFSPSWQIVLGCLEPNTCPTHLFAQISVLTPSPVQIRLLDYEVLVLLLLFLQLNVLPIATEWAFILRRKQFNILKYTNIIKRDPLGFILF